jgi:hypothetical protein
MNWSSLKEALVAQKVFSDIFFDSDNLSDKQKEEMLKTFALAMHSEVTGIVEGVNYKDHRTAKKAVDVQKILYKSVDAYRYILAILNLWGINSSTFETALAQKDDFLHYRHKLSQKKWDGQPVVLFDMDDVLAEFRKSFCGWVTSTTGHFLDPESKEYYNTDVLKKAGLNNEALFKGFIDSHGFLLLERNEPYFELLQFLKSQGFWVQIVTARPESDLTVFYDTYSWLSRHNVEVDGVAFTSEKFMFLADQQYYSSGRYFAVDDSAKHAAEYAKHGVCVVVPEKTYNQEVSGLSGVLYVPRDQDPKSFVQKSGLIDV